LVILIHLIQLGYAHQWTGFGQTKVNNDIQPAKTLWDWLALLIVPIVLAIGGYLFSRSESRATQAATERRAQDDALQAYLDQVGQLLLDKDPPLRQSEEDSEVRTLARARTLSVLARLDGGRKAQVVQFLYELDLITAGRVIVDLKNADLSGVILMGANLMEVHLSKAYMFEAKLQGARLQHADLSGADLSGANLHSTKLSEANLSAAILGVINPNTAALISANLYGADLSGANLEGIGGGDILLAQLLAQYVSLQGATMPDGQQYEDRFKSRAEDGKNSGPS